MLYIKYQLKITIIKKFFKNNSLKISIIIIFYILLIYLFLKFNKQFILLIITIYLVINNILKIK